MTPIVATHTPDGGHTIATTIAGHNITLVRISPDRQVQVVRPGPFTPQIIPTLTAALKLAQEIALAEECRP